MSRLRPAVARLIGLARQRELQRIGAGEDIGRQDRDRGDVEEKLVGLVAKSVTSRNSWTRPLVIQSEFAGEPVGVLAREPAAGKCRPWPQRGISRAKHRPGEEGAADRDERPMLMSAAPHGPTRMLAARPPSRGP